MRLVSGGQGVPWIPKDPRIRTTDFHKRDHRDFHILSGKWFIIFFKKNTPKKINKHKKTGVLFFFFFAKTMSC